MKRLVVPDGASLEELCAIFRTLPEGQALIEATRRQRDENVLVEHVVGHSADGESRIAISSRPDLVEVRREAMRAAEGAMLAAGMPASGGAWLSVLARCLP